MQATGIQRGGYVLNLSPPTTVVIATYRWTRSSRATKHPHHLDTLQEHKEFIKLQTCPAMGDFKDIK